MRKLEGSSPASTATNNLIHYLESLKDCRYTILYNSPETVLNADNSILVNKQKGIQQFCITQCNGIDCQDQFKM
eukprot:3928002-Ditylum_brightwellii.AAC.1